MKKEIRNEKTNVALSVLLALFALVSMTAVTVAWLSIADSARVANMKLDVTKGINLRFDLSAHQTIDEYYRVLGFDEIADRILREKGYDIKQKGLEPVTTENYQNFTYENGKAVSDTSGDYWEFTLHFMAGEDMYVYLTAEESEQGDDGTKIISDNPELAKAMRVSFAAEGETALWNGEESVKLFYIQEHTDKPVVVRIWLEGTDPACTDKLKNIDWAIQMRFVGRDENGNPLDKKPQSLE